MNQIYNPYLPLTEYVPDGEPHVFDGRVYIYGSHDVSDGKVYCEADYVTWSAPVTDLTDWKYEGVIYRKNQDPSNSDGSMQLWAPDVTKGPDGRYYLYYCFNFYPEIGVAVSDNPAGPFEYYGHVHYPKNILGGKIVQEEMVFDPAVLTDDDGRVYLYYGFAPGGEKTIEIPQYTEAELDALPDEHKQQILQAMNIKFGKNSMVVELEKDMLTTKEMPRSLIPGEGNSFGTSFEGHGFFEASSIRKINGKYYFVYSSHKSHELCYATSNSPDRDFVYGGTIVSNGDIGLNNRINPVYTLGNNHGGIEKINDKYYIFYHRPTNGTEASRQGCAEEIKIQSDGSIKQVEITSCGLNGGPLIADGSYPASIACHITCKTTLSRIDYQNPVMATQTRVTQKRNISYITSIQDGTTIGYKYFSFTGSEHLLLELKGTFEGMIQVFHEENGKCIGKCGEIATDSSWKIYSISTKPEIGVHSLYIMFTGKGELEMKSLAFIKNHSI